MLFLDVSSALVTTVSSRLRPSDGKELFTSCACIFIRVT